MSLRGWKHQLGKMEGRMVDVSSAVEPSRETLQELVKTQHGLPDDQEVRRVKKETKLLL